MDLLETKGLTRAFRSRKSPFAKPIEVQALRGVDLSIRQGEILGLVGESGSGKSTLGNLIAGLKKPTQGQICYRGQDITRSKDRRAHGIDTEIQMIFQDSVASFNPKKTLGWLLEEPLRLHHRTKSRTQRQEILQELLHRVGLSRELLTRYPKELSGGQAQRFNIALALILNPELLVADEAVSSLDVSLQAQVLNLMNDLKEELGLTYLFISHNLDVVRAMSDRIAVMYLGQIVELGPTEDVYQNRAHPYTQALIAAVPKLDVSPAKSLLLKGELPDPSSIPTGCPFHPRCPKALPQCALEDPAPRLVGQSRVRCHLWPTNPA
ncbi:Oligopeptide transport ATP-binding protein OppF [Clostridiaceae bacterium JG1575]|nr:Oligopeptide transport ATP-binding protein OppF [Clostridiaceae bacterium JG1575]